MSIVNLNNDLIFVSGSEAKVKAKLFKLSKCFKEKEYLKAYEKYKYCPNCSQAIDWSDEDVD